MNTDKIKTFRFTWELRTSKGTNEVHARNPEIAYQIALLMAQDATGGNRKVKVTMGSVQEWN